MNSSKQKEIFSKAEDFVDTVSSAKTGAISF